MAVCADSFTNWLGKKLTELNTDENIFGMYIQGILDGDETQEEKIEALQGILTEIIENENDITKACNEIMDMWVKYKSEEPPPKEPASGEDMDVKLVKLLESQALTATKQRQYTEEEKKIREAILSQYSQMSDDDEEGTNATNCLGDHKESSSKLEKNTNALTVLHAEKEKREQARLESQRKKDKDKEDREKQKQMREDKKEKRKTQKGERRR